MNGTDDGLGIGNNLLGLLKLLKQIPVGRLHARIFIGFFASDNNGQVSQGLFGALLEITVLAPAGNIEFTGDFGNHHI